MSKVSILLVCGSGASSGFMAANLRKAAKNRGLDLEIKARGDSEIENYIEDIDVLLIGPHLEYILEDAKEMAEGTDVKVILMHKDYYSTLDGEKALDHLVAEM